MAFLLCGFNSHEEYDKGVHYPLISNLSSRNVMLSNKVRQSPDVKGISIFGQERKLGQFADNTSSFAQR